jgi:SPP1 gp7 family putative phage head morphogenesis protein
MSMGVVESYTIQDGAGKQSPLPAEMVVRCFFPDPESPWTSEGYLGPTGITVDSQKFAGQHLRSHYQNDATPPTVLEAGPDATPWTPEQKQVFYADWNQRYHNRLGRDRGGPGITPTGYKLVQMAMQSGSEIRPLLEHWRDDTLMAFGTPRSILGQVVSGDRSSAETNQYVFDKHTILPIATMISDALTHQLAPDFDPSLFVEFEPFVSEDKRFELEREQSDLDRKVKSINMVLIDRGNDPVDWGEEPVGKIGEVPYDGSGGFMLPPSGDGAIEDEEPEPVPPEGEPEDLEPDEPRSRTNGSDVFFAPRAEWQRQVAREQKFMPAFAKAIRLIFKAQREDVLKKLKDATPRARVTAEELFNPEDPRWARLFRLRVEPTREVAFLEILGETLAGLGIDDFVFSDQMKSLLKQHGAQLVKHTGRTTKRRIAEALVKGTEEGEGVGQIAKRIRSVFAERTRNHAVTIARTEIGRAATNAHIESYKLAGVEQHRWNTSMDDAVRETHQTVNPDVVDVGSPFTLGDGELALGPREGVGGTDLTAGNSINCRCFLTPVRRKI